MRGNVLSSERVLESGRLRACSGMAVHRRVVRRLTFGGGSIARRSLVHFVQDRSCSNLSSVAQAIDGE